LLILRTKFPEIENEHEAGGDRGHFRELLRYPHFLLAVVAQFMYVGAQVGTWSYFIQYVQDYTHRPEKVAGYFLTGTLAAFGVGRFVSAYLMRLISPKKLLGIYALINVGLVSVGVVWPGGTGLWAVFLTSFFMSLMFPTIFALGLKKLRPNTKIGGSLIVMAIVGGAMLTPLMGLIAEAYSSIALAYLVPLVAYVFVAVYAFAGAKAGLQEAK
jgi:FHS family L-fucose permease-like MFS transporter